MFDCAFCGKPYSPRVGCCDKAALASALTVIQYHIDCDHEDVSNALAQLRDREKAWEEGLEVAMIV